MKHCPWHGQARHAVSGQAPSISPDILRPARESGGPNTWQGHGVAAECRCPCAQAARSACRHYCRPGAVLCHNQVKFNPSGRRDGPIFDPPRPPSELHQPCPTELANTRAIVPRALIYRHLHSSIPSNPPSRAGAGDLTEPPL